MFRGLYPHLTLKVQPPTTAIEQNPYNPSSYFQLRFPRFEQVYEILRSAYKPWENIEKAKSYFEIAMYLNCICIGEQACSDFVEHANIALVKTNTPTTFEQIWEVYKQGMCSDLKDFSEIVELSRRGKEYRIYAFEIFSRMAETVLNAIIHSSVQWVYDELPKVESIRYGSDIKEIRPNQYINRSEQTKEVSSEEYQERFATCIRAAMNAAMQNVLKNN